MLVDAPLVTFLIAFRPQNFIFASIIKLVGDQLRQE